MEFRTVVKPLLIIGVLALAAFLLHRTLGRFTWEQIIASLAAVPLLRIAASAAFAAASYICLTGFDWLAVRYTGHRLPYRKVALASFCSLSLGHSIGFAALSSGAVRYRFYSQWGLKTGDIAKVIVFCGATVALGLMVLGGFAVLLRPDLAQEITGLGGPVLTAIGATCLALTLLYLLLAATLHRDFCIGRWTLHMPSLAVAAGQVIVGALNFVFVAACLYQALAGLADINFIAVATVFVLANVATLITHVPGGLGVIEGVVLYLLPQSGIIGGLLVFRLTYFLLPLVLGSLAFAAAEGFRRP